MSVLYIASDGRGAGKTTLSAALAVILSRHDASVRVFKPFAAAAYTSAGHGFVGAGGLGHIGIQVLRSLCAADIIVVDRAEGALKHAENFGVAHTVLADGNEIERVKELTKGYGAEAVIDFVGEGNAVANGLAMTRDAGTYYIVGYGGRLEIPTMEMVVSEKSIVGNLVGTYPELVELMEMADRGLVDLATREYKLSEANQALHDLDAGQVPGRAVLIP